MARLIDADALLEKMDRVLPMEDDISECVSTCARTARRLVAKAPIVDAVEVVHGRWEDAYCGRYANPRFQCSVCKEFALRKSERDWLGTWHEGQALTRYCPNCGAELKEE
jgi:hypothetical protein